MKIEEIKLENVRSHTHTVIKFSEGINVIYGDIGSGKSSILKAIEFALLGTHPELKGETLLRKGARQGKVELKMKIPWKDGEEKECIIRRRLVREGGRVREYGYVEIVLAGKTYVKSKSEAREFILRNILEVPEKVAPTAKPLVFRSIFYIPQHEMRRILEGRKEEREEVLRRILQLEKYKQIKEALSEAKKTIRLKLARYEDKYKIYEKRVQEKNKLETELINLESKLPKIAEEKEKVKLEIEKLKRMKQRRY